MRRDSRFARTKIIGTLGPASRDPAILGAMIDAGLDVVRINCSHTDSTELAEMIAFVRRVADDHGEPIAVLADLGGPKIRLGTLESDIPVRTGDEVVLTTDSSVTTDRRIPAGYPGLADDLKAGNRILIDDGLVQLEVVEAAPPDLRCRALNDGVLKSRKGINLPGVAISVPSITEKDRRDIAVLVEQPVDFIALSFVRSPEEVRELRRMLEERGRRIPVIAKIEKPEAVDRMDAIIDEADIVMVARGDLGVEMPAQDVPLIQKRIIAECNRRNTPVITATQMLDSMIGHPRPTRAEASDVANAVFDGTDTVMLSGETSVGRYPVEAVAMMDRVVRTAETHRRGNPAYFRRDEAPMARDETICRSACMMADEVGARSIICLSRSGRTAQLLSRYRPNVPIVAFTESMEAVRYLNIVWGVQGELLDQMGDTDASLERAAAKARELGYVDVGDTAVYTASIPLDETASTNMITIRTA